MERRDWELLDKQLHRHQSQRNDGSIISTAVAVFIAGRNPRRPPGSARKQANEDSRRTMLEL